MDKKYIVYKHTSPNGKVYIGITGKTAEERWQNGRGYKANKHFYNAIKKYGWDNIKHEILYQNLKAEEAYKIEKELIKKYQSNNLKNGYNKSIGGEKTSLGCKQPLEANLKRSNALKGCIPWNKGIHTTNSGCFKKGDIPWSKGKKVSDEVKEKIKNKSKGKHYSPRTEFKKGNKPWTTGKKMTKEFKEKLSKAHLGQIPWNRKKVICLDNNIIYSSIAETSRILNINETSITRVCHNKQKTAGGYHFKFYD